MASALEELPGVKNVKAIFPEKRTVVVYDQASVTIEQMCQALLKAGYVANPKATNTTTHTISHDESRNMSDHQTDNLICYCFEYTRDDIEQDFIRSGRSLIIERIAAEKKSGSCDCAKKNPKGR